MGSLMVVECDEGSSVGSGDRFSVVGCGIVVSNISERSKVENVRFASSAINWVRVWHGGIEFIPTYSSENEVLHEVCASFVLKVWLESHHREANCSWLGGLVLLGLE